MKTNFVWTDLSTFQVEAAVSFYRSVLGWDVSGEAGYMNCSAQGSPCAGIYEMPEFFQSIRMPSFWMTYISVEDAAATAARAAELGGKVELEEETPRGRVALICDPAGAGFTCYEGKELSANRDSSIPGNWCWSELMVSDFNLVREFYEGIFGWKFRSAGQDRYSILTSSGEEIGAVQVAENEVKGDKEFWAVYFAGDDLERVSASILEAGGSIEGIYEHEEGRQLLAYDSQGAAFFLLEKITGATHSAVSAAPVVSSGKKRWR
ncbi:MAG: VOC family protein, partial [Verrucomicrobiota bacterium]